VGYVWGTEKAIKEANKGSTGFTIGKWWAVLIRYVVPIIIAAIMVTGILDSLGR